MTMASFADEIAARYSAVTPTGDDAVRWQGAMSTAAALYEDLASNSYLGTATRRTIETYLFTILDSLSAIFGTGNMEAVETALEAIRTTVYTALPSHSRQAYDPNYIGTTTIDSGVSIEFGYGYLAGGPGPRGGLSEFLDG